MWLVDNNVPRSVTDLLRGRGDVALEVRSVLGANAEDTAIAAYALVRELRVVTHDTAFARVCKADGIPHLWLRTSEHEDRAKLAARLGEINAAFARGVVRVALTRGGTVQVDETAGGR